MNKSEITKEILSEINIEIEETLFYMPGETIKGTIKLNPGIKFNIKDNLLHFDLKLIQYEFWDYSDVKAKELKNVYKTEIQTKSIDYKLKEDEITNYEEKVKIGDFSMILLEKEEKDKFISVPFEFVLDENNEKLLPTFQYETDKYFLGIRHLLIIKSIEYSSKNYVGLFIGKNRNKELIKEKTMQNYYYAGLGSLDLKVTIPKQTYYFGEEMPFNLESSANLIFKKVTEIQTDLSRKIEWVGYMKNSKLDKKSLQNNFTYNQDKYSIASKITLPLEILGDINFVSNLGNRIIGIFGFAYLMSELASKFLIAREILRLDAQDNEFKEDEKIVTKFDPTLSSVYNKKEIKDATEGIKKFVYFKDKKVVGFVKFIRNITPPVKGYYFNCNFNFKIHVHIAGMIFDQNKTMSTDIEFYDGETYIKKMKSILSVDNLLQSIIKK